MFTALDFIQFLESCLYRAAGDTRGSTGRRNASMAHDASFSSRNQAARAFAQKGFYQFKTSLY